MKTAYAIGGLCAIIVLVGGYMYLGKKHDATKEEVSHIMLYKEYGFITWKNKDDTEYTRVDGDETELPNNVYVKTVKGRGYVILPDNSSISLDENTEILVSYDGGSTSIMQYLGSTYHRVESLVAGKTYEVRTPNTLATVRGTKLMVTYDDKKKTSKVDVTEHIVEITKLENGSTTENPTAVSEGGTAIIGATSTGELTLDVKSTSDTQEKNTWFEENKVIDQVVDQGGNKRETIKEILDNLRTGDNNPDTNEEDRLQQVNDAVNKVKTNKDDGNEKKEDDKPTNTEKKPEPKKDDTPKPPVKKDEVKEEVKDVGTPPIKKIDEEVFFDKFNDLFVNNFYLDDNDTACNNVAPEEKVRIVSSYASQSGYAFTSRTLLSFAQAIDAYCKNKDVGTKAKLQARFDDEFPFNDQ